LAAVTWSDANSVTAKTFKGKESGMTIVIDIAEHLFFPKNSHLHIVSTHTQ